MNSESSLYNVRPGEFHQTLEIPSSKSHANRALIIGALRGNGFKVSNLSESTDVQTLIRCLEQVGLKIKKGIKSATFLNSFPECEAESSSEVIDLKTGDGGTTNRFLLALLSRGKKTYRFFPTEKMSERPIDDLVNPLKELNVEIKKMGHGVWIEIQGPATMVKTSKIMIDCKESTQFASAMMLAFSNLPLTIEYKNVVASHSYLEMTKHLLNQTTLQNFYHVPVDFSSASYPLALGLVGGSTVIRNCHELDSYQADAQFIELMKAHGAQIDFSQEGLRAVKSTLSPFQVDGSVYPDLVPTLAFMASFIEGESVLTNLSILRHKESDRLEELMKLLKKFSVIFQFDSSRDEIKIQGKMKKALDMDIVTARDHRLVMTAYLFLRMNSGGRLYEADCVDKSFPHFYKLMEG